MSRPEPSPPPLTHWIEDPTSAKIQPIVSSGFSGAHLWQVEHGRNLFVLRRWPSSTNAASRLTDLHSFQQRLQSQGCPVPIPMATLAGQTYVKHDGAYWELATWMAGVADYWQAPSPAKLRAALAALATIHLAEARSSGRARLLPSRSEPHGSAGASPSQVSPALQRRSERLEQLEASGLAELAQTIASLPDSNEKPIASETLDLIAGSVPHQGRISHRWRDAVLPLQWCLRDVWHDHILFTGDQVTGVIDFGAAAIDSPAGDIARLLGSLVGDDREGWRLGLDAYAAVLPLSPPELGAVQFFDSSGTVLSAANWLHWLYREPAVLGEKVDRPACLKRLQRLTIRLRTLAATSRS